MYQILIWFALCLIFILLELTIPGLFYFLSFAVGALATVFFSLFLDDLAQQLVIFALFSGTAFFVLTVWVKQMVVKPEMLSNIDALLGKKGTIIKEILPHQKGLVKVQGEIWSAYSDVLLEVNVQIKIIDVKGSHLIVEKIEEL